MTYHTSQSSHVAAIKTTPCIRQAFLQTSKLLWSIFGNLFFGIHCINVGPLPQLHAHHITSMMLQVLLQGKDGFVSLFLCLFFFYLRKESDRKMRQGTQTKSRLLIGNQPIQVQVNYKSRRICSSRFKICQLKLACLQSM